MRRSPLSVNLFGPTLFRCGGRPCALGLKGTTLELLLYLVSNAGQPLRREFVADQFWRASSEARQRSALNSAIWRIGKKLPAHPGLRLQSTDATVSMTIEDDIAVDVRDLCALVREAAAGGLTAERAARLGAALADSEAPLMDGLASDWTLAERERIAAIRIRGMIALMHWHGDNRNYEEALQIGRRLLAEDPYRESVQIDMMWLYVLNGQRAQAIRQYTAFAATLRTELAIEPMLETRAVYDHIRTGLDQRTDRGSAATSLPVPQRPGAPHGLGAILSALEQSRREVYRVLRAQLG